MALERFRLKKQHELKSLFTELQEKEGLFISEGLDFSQLLIGDPSVIPLFSCCKCLRAPTLRSEASSSKKTKNTEYVKTRWRYICEHCNSTPTNHSKSMLLAKMEWDFNNYVVWSSEKISVFDLKNLDLEEKKNQLHRIRQALECHVNLMEVAYFIDYNRKNEREKARALEDIEKYKLFLQWQVIAQRIVAHEIRQTEL